MTSAGAILGTENLETEFMDERRRRPPRGGVRGEVLGHQPRLRAVRVGAEHGLRSAREFVRVRRWAGLLVLA